MKDVAAKFLQQVGKNIRKKRIERKLSLQELGYKVGLSRMQVHRIERGYNITLTTLLKFSLAFDIPMADLLKCKTILNDEDLEWLVNNNKANRAT